MAGVFYCQREDIAFALDVKLTAQSAAEIDRAIDSASRNVEGLCHRHFYPLTTIRYFDYPNKQSAGIGRLWLDRWELISVSAFTSGGVTVPPANYYLEPNWGPPFNRIEVNRGSSSALSSSSLTSQRALAISGVFGYSAEEENGGTAAEAMDLTETGLDGSGSPSVGVGSILRIDTERMIVTDRSWLTSGQTLLTPVAASMSAVALAVTDGTQFAAREVLLLDSERMLVVEVAGNTLTVRRAVQGSTLAGHTGSAIYWPRTLTVTRGALGTTAATHLISAPMYLHVVPALIRELTQAYAEAYCLQRNAGWARTVGSEQNEREASGRGIRSLEDDVYQAYGRKARIR